MDVVRHQPNQGWIEVIVGSMFSGKSEELIRRLRRAQIARQKVQIFKPAIDTRYATTTSSRTARCGFRRARVRNSRELLELVERRHRSRRHRRRAVLRSGPAGRRATRSPTAASASSSPASTRTTSASRSSRCRSCWRSRNTSPRRWRSAWSAAIPANHTQRLVPSGDRVLRRRAGHVRSALPRTASIRTLARRDKSRSRESQEPKSQEV